jgi:hypothetical protein
MRFALRTLAPIARCAYLHVGEMLRQKKRLSPNYSDTFSEEILIFKDWAAAAKASARRICDSMCRRRE